MKIVANSFEFPQHEQSRFWSKVCKSEACWEWTAAKNSRGYGQFAPYLGQAAGAHRYSYLLHFGEIPEGLNVCHHCDNPGCVRPDHLFLGTHADNMRDAQSKGRIRRSCKARIEGNGFGSHLTTLRLACGLTQEQLAKAAGLERKTINRLERGHRQPTLPNLQRLAEALGVSITQLAE